MDSDKTLQQFLHEADVEMTLRNVPVGLSEEFMTHLPPGVMEDYTLATPVPLTVLEPLLDRYFEGLASERGSVDPAYFGGSIEALAYGYGDARTVLMMRKNDEGFVESVLLMASPDPTLD